MLKTSAWTIGEWQQAYRDGQSPRGLLTDLLAFLDNKDPAWISLISATKLEMRLDQLEIAASDLDDLPLYGIPFAVKDNIDVADLPTTCACPAFTYTPTQDATVIKKLLAAGAVAIGKTNLDQFATGLVGTRSPYGIVPNTFNKRYICGGSSSGSASVVARGLVPFALGTDTAGSGRVPAGLNNIVGLKPSIGLISTTGVVPACRTLDCVSLFTLNVADADCLRLICGGLDTNNAYSREIFGSTRDISIKPILGIPSSPQFFGDGQSSDAWDLTLEHLKAMGAILKPVDFTVLHKTAALLYEGPWVAERYAAIETILTAHPEAINPVVRRIIERANGISAVDAFKGEYQRVALKQKANEIMAGVDALVVPTTPGIYTLAEIEQEPTLLNNQLGTYTNFVNLLDWCALSTPSEIRNDGLPFGVTFIGPCGYDATLASFARHWEQTRSLPLGATGRAPTHLAPHPLTPATRGAAEDMTPKPITIAVVGAHLSGMPLNGQLTERGAVLLETTKTAATYKLFALPGTVPPKPALLRVAEGGCAIIIELWAMPTEHFGAFVGLIPSPLGIGTLTLDDGREVKGFICEPWVLDNAQDISEFGGWRSYMANRA